MAVIENPQTDTVTTAINLTPTAAEAIRDLLTKKDAQDHALRVFVQGGGCSGYQYGMALDPNTRDDDIVSECHGVRVVVDEVSIRYMYGSTIDYVEDVMGSGFKVENPNAMASCGCGNSFQTEQGCAPQDNSAAGCSGCG
jgi:iron-sulfur cluster assembly protein